MLAEERANNADKTPIIKNTQNDYMMNQPFDETIYNEEKTFMAWSQTRVYFCEYSYGYLRVCSVTRDPPP